MAEEGSEDQSETGGSLRAKLESSLAENREMAAELRGFKAAAIITDKGYKYVTTEDLKDVPLAEQAVKAEALEAAKATQRETVLREVLASQGYADAELDTAVSNLLNPQESHAETSTRLNSLSRISGSAPGAHDNEVLEGFDLIKVGLAENAAKRKPIV